MAEAALPLRTWTPDAATDPDMPTAGGAAVVRANEKPSQKVIDAAYFFTKIGMPGVAMCGVMVALGWLGLTILKPQNDASIENQKALREQLTVTVTLATAVERLTDFGQAQVKRTEQDERIAETLKSISATMQSILANQRGNK